MVEIVSLETAPTGGGLAVDRNGDVIAGPRFYDRDFGTVTRALDLAALDVASVASITPIENGDFGGNYGLIENGSSELVIFSVP